MVQFANTGGGQVAGWTDQTSGTNIPGTASNTNPLAAGGLIVQTTVTYSHAAWCGGAVHDIFTVSRFRIHNSITHTWGSYRNFVRIPDYLIQC